MRRIGAGQRDPRRRRAATSGGRRPVEEDLRRRAAGRCRSTPATRRRRRRRRSRRGRRGGAAAGRGCRARRSTRRSGPRRGSARRRPAAARASDVDGRPSEVSATIGWRAPYRAGRMSSVIPASMTTWRPPRSRTWRTRATSQPERATSARPGSMARRVGRRSSGSASSSAGSSRANRSGPGVGSSSGKTGKPPPTSSVSNVSSVPRSRATTASPRRTASRHASTARSCEPTWRWTPRGRIAPPPPLASQPTTPVASVSVIPNLDAPAPTASASMVSGVTSGLSRTRTSSGGRPPRPSPARWAIRARTSASSPDSMRDPGRAASTRSRPRGPPPAGPRRSCRRPRA